MYERLLDKNTSPSENFIREYLGNEGYSNLQCFESFLDENYDLKRELKFPFGNKYGWGYKYSHRSNHLCHAFIEAGAFTVTLQLGDSCVSEVEKILPALSKKANGLWKDRYPCGEQGGWLHYRVIKEDELKDLFELIKIKKKPIR
jgi:hypothetical protein